MSILPSRNLGPASSSSSSSQLSIPNPNSNHGVLSPSQQQRQLSSSPDNSSANFQCLRISDSDPSPAASTSNFSGPGVLVDDDSGGSSGQVNESKSPSYGNKEVHAIADKTLQQECAGRERVTSAGSRGKSSATNVSTSSNHNSPSTSTRECSSLSGGRRNQIISGNHLLNFYYDPISRPQPRAPPSRRQQKIKPYNKDLFLQANYKFVVLDTEDYSPESMDPDKMLRWEDIICVKYSTPFPVQCPICLEDPLCSQITSCGHIFCFPCIMQYFSMDDYDHKSESWKKCPLCFTMTSVKDLYTVHIEKVKHYGVGDTVDFLLLSRQKDVFTLAVKNNGGTSAKQVQDTFSKFTFTSDVDLAVREAMSELDGWLAKADSGLVDDLGKLPYVCTAMEQLEQRKSYWNERRASIANKAHNITLSRTSSFGSPPSGNASSDLDASKFIFGTVSTHSNDKSCLLEQSSPDKKDKTSHSTQMPQTACFAETRTENEGLYSSSCENKKSMPFNHNGIKEREDRGSYSFYQAVDGQPIILHPLNMKCLLHHYGSYDVLPDRISGKILQLESVTQSEAIRRRYRFLSHFSLTTAFQLCEIDLFAILPFDALSPFIDEIRNREKQRKRLAKKERQEKLRAGAVGSDYVPVPFNISKPSHDEQPTFSMDDFEALGTPAVTSSTLHAAGERQLFSSVARLGFAAGHDSPSLRAEEPQSLLKANASCNSSSGAGITSAGTLSFAHVTSKTQSTEGPDMSKMNETGKKGKKQNRVLLSTAGGRRY